MNQYKSVYNWLGLGLLALVVLGLCYLTMSGRPATETDESPTASSLASSHMVTPAQNAASTQPSPPTLSPLAVPAQMAASSQMASPLSANLASPLPKPAPSSTGMTSSFELTVLHTNDTWGYLLPCG